MKKILLSISVLLTAVCCLAVTAYSVDKLKVNTAKLEISKVSDADMPSGKQLKSVNTQTRSYDDRPEFTPGAPLYLTGDAENFDITWDPETPAQFTYADGVYTFEATGVSQIKISYTPGDWDTFNLTALSVDGGDITKAMLGTPQPLTWWDSSIRFPIKADYKIEVAGDLSTITVTTEAEIPDATTPEVFLRGDMNSWAVDAEWQFESVGGKYYKFVTPEPIIAGMSFKVADANWGKINYSTMDDYMYEEVTYEMYYNSSYNMSFAEDFSGVIWIDINTEFPKFEVSSNYDYIPAWVEGITPELPEREWVTVNVENPGEFAEIYLTQNNYDWSGVYYLKVTGNISDQDVKNIKNVSNLLKLDLSETTITEIPAQFMYGKYLLSEAMLPSTIETIGSYAFEGCKSLTKCDLSGVENIGDYAFKSCISLEEINLTGVKTIGDAAFSSCVALCDVDMSSIESLGEMAFGGCINITAVDLSSLKESGSNVFSGCTGLKSVVFPENIKMVPTGMFATTGLESIIIPQGVTTIKNGAFSGCEFLKEVIFPESINLIYQYAFQNCISLESVEFPAGLLQIGADAFYGCTALSEITIPELVNYLGSRIFGKTGITRIKSKAVTPPSLGGSMFESRKDMTAMELYVPSISKDAYRNSDYWSEFYIMRSLEEPISNIRVTSPLTINLREEDGALLSAKPSISLTSNDFNTYSTNELGQLTAIGEGTLSAGELFFESAIDARYYSYRWSNGGRYPTLINYADKMRADNVTHVFHFPNTTNPWAFISLPYDVKVSDIVPSNDTYWVIRRYDSAARAAGETGSTWVNLTNDDTLEAGKGYIVSVFGGEIREDGYRYLPNLTFSSGNSVTKNNIFRSTDVIVPLAEYESEYAHNRSWNFIGNPYPSYFDMHCLNEEFTAPITIWNGRSYVAYSPVDDDLVLRPYESFFVQCPLNANSITFKEEGRMHYYEGYDRIKVRPRSLAEASLSAEDRNVFNFTIKGENSEDRARIVFNRDAASTYEVGCDASKFFADDNAEAQIFVKGDVDYSICERPVADAEAVLGIAGGVDKTYTISLSGRYSDEWRVLLTDNVTGITVDLTKEDYEFVANGDNGSRFGIRFELAGNVESGIQGITGDFGAEAEVSVCTLDGVTVFRGRASEISVESAGLYIVTDGEKSRKAILK